MNSFHLMLILLRKYLFNIQRHAVAGFVYAKGFKVAPTNLHVHVTNQAAMAA